MLNATVNATVNGFAQCDSQWFGEHACKQRAQITRYHKSATCQDWLFSAWAELYNVFQGFLSSSIERTRHIR